MSHFPGYMVRDPCKISGRQNMGNGYTFGYPHICGCWQRSLPIQRSIASPAIKIYFLKNHMITILFWYEPYTLKI